jgi:anti-sigma factor RsiW
MMISDETLMAYADGELDAAARAAVELAMQSDPQIASRVARHRALRRRVQNAYAAELSEGLPERLLAAAQGPPRRQPTHRISAGWHTSLAIAASLIAGVGLGFFMWGRTQSSLTLDAGGALVARGSLARALSNQLASEPSRTAAVRVELSFLAKSGEYCRAFSLAGAASAAGVACRHDGEWQVQALARGPGAGRDSDYRTAASGLPAPILRSVEGLIAGEPLDQTGERAARERGWKLPQR